MKLLLIGMILGCLLTAGITYGFDSKLWRFGTEVAASEKLDQIQHQHRAILEQQDHLERLIQQSCGVKP